MENYFKKLNEINVQDKIEKKNGLNYLSWAWAWTEIKKMFENAFYTIYERDTEYGPVNYFTDGKTCWVKTGVTINGIEHIEELPVMDFKNKSILLENVTSFDINKTIQRSLTKACARHGLGLYVYAGEDLPEEEKNKTNEEIIKDGPVSDTEARVIYKALINKLESNEKVVEYLMNNYNIENTSKLMKSQYAEIVREFK